MIQSNLEISAHIIHTLYLKSSSPGVITSPGKKILPLCWRDIVPPQWVLTTLMGWILMVSFCILNRSPHREPKSVYLKIHKHVYQQSAWICLVWYQRAMRYFYIITILYYWQDYKNVSQICHINIFPKFVERP